MEWSHGDHPTRSSHFFIPYPFHFFIPVNPIFILFLHPTPSSRFFTRVYSFIPFLHPIFTAHSHPISFSCIYPLFIPFLHHPIPLSGHTPLPQEPMPTVSQGPPCSPSIPPGRGAALHMLLPVSVPPPVSPCPPMLHHHPMAPCPLTSPHPPMSQHPSAESPCPNVSLPSPAVRRGRCQRGTKKHPGPPPPRSTGFI